MQKVRIVTHSGCDLTFDMAQELGVIMLPDLVVFGQEQFRNNMDIHPEEFYRRIRGSEIFPTSAHPTLTEFMDAYRAAGDCEEILCLVMSSRMTSTINTAKIAAQMLAEEGFEPTIHVYDSMQVSFGLGLSVMDAARMARSGASAAEIIRYLDDITPRIGVYFVMQSLKYAHKGGRNLPNMQGESNSRILSDREIEVMILIVEGHINKEIADQLHIGLSTVITHRRNIMEKLNIKSVSALTIYAVMNGYVDINRI